MANGLLNTSQLTDVGGGKLLRADAARAWLALVAGCFAATGVRLTLTEGYRNLARQVFFWLKWVARVPGYNVAAKPGTSNHGLGIAVDMGNYSLAWNWLLLNAHTYGWSWAQGKASGERWHWVYIGGETNTTPANASKPVAIPHPPKRKRHQLSVGYIKEAASTTVYAVDLETPGVPLRPILTAEYLAGVSVGIEVQTVAERAFQDLLRERGVLLQDKYYRPEPFVPGQPNIIAWNGFGVSRPNL